MAISFQAVTLDVPTPDSEGGLIFRDGRLLAVVSRLSDMHDDLSGQWYIEAVFNEGATPVQRTFQSLAELENELGATALS